jgi:hypothetical protein
MEIACVSMRMHEAWGHKVLQQLLPAPTGVKLAPTVYVVQVKSCAGCNIVLSCCFLQCCIPFVDLQHLQLVSCRNVRNRDLYVLANNDLRLTRLVLGDDTNKPWVTNRWVWPGCSGLDCVGILQVILLASPACSSAHDTGNALPRLVLAFDSFCG